MSKKLSYETQGPALTLDDLMEKVPFESNVEFVNYWRDPSQSLIDEYVRKYEINSGCSSECVTCQITHIEKYKSLYPEKPSVSKAKFQKIIDSGEGDPKLSHAFQISCPFIPKNYIDDLPQSLVNNASDEDLNTLIAVKDPVEFAFQYFGWKARTHQATMLRCQSERKVLRWGRRSGKTESFAIEILFHAMTKKAMDRDPRTGEWRAKDYTVMVVAPYESQIINIFDMLLRFLNSSEETTAVIDRFRKSPYHFLKLKNGAIIKGFTTGAKSSSDAASLRGQDANMLVLDECDFMTAGDYGSINPIIQSHGKDEKGQGVLVRASSTPKGKRENFYDWCVTNPLWKEFYFPSAVIDMTPYEETRLSWRNMRVDNRPDYSHDEWLQEILAVFIANASGVYQPVYIHEAMEDYEYEEMRQIKMRGGFKNWTFAIGTDWNDNAGTEICVLGFAPGLGYRIVENVNVPKQDWTQLRGMEVLTELAGFWQPEFIYVDAGHGSTNYEMLRLWSGQQPAHSYESTIVDRIKKYYFGGSLEIRDPLSQEIVKQPAKAYMVEASVRKFENRQIKFSASDEVLRKQLLNYIVKSRAESGKPLYGMENPKIGDHRLDALNMAIVAFEREMGAMALTPRTSIFNAVGVLGTNIHQMAAKALAGSGQTEGQYRPEYFDTNSRTALSEVVTARKRSIKQRNDKIEGVAGEQDQFEAWFPPHHFGYSNDTEHVSHAQWEQQRSARNVRRRSQGIFKSRSNF
jgi:hypothetical protein